MLSSPSAQLMLQLLHSISPPMTQAAATSVLLRCLSRHSACIGLGGFQSRSYVDVAVSSSSSSSPSSAPTAAEVQQPQPEITDAITGSLPRKQNRHQQLTRHSEQHLKLAGLWVPISVYRALPQQYKDQLVTWQKQYSQLLQLQQPLRGTNMSIMALNPNQLQVVVALASDAADDSSSSSSSSGSGLIEQQQQHEQQDWTSSSRNGGGGSKSSSGSGSGSGSSSSSSSSALGFGFLTQPKLSKSSLARQSSESRLIINLNSQMKTAYGQDNHTKVISLFDSLLAKGIAEAQEAAAAAAAAAAGEQQQQQQRLQLPVRYRPDEDTLAMYCRSLLMLADVQERSSRGRGGRAGGPLVDRFSPDGAAAASPPASPPVSCSVDRAEQAAALWGSTRIAGPGFPVHMALMQAYRLAGQHSKAVDVFMALRASNTAQLLSHHYRLHVTALRAAVDAHDYEAANDIARAFSGRRVSFKEGDYRARLVWLYRSLVKGAAAHSKWEDAIYWLQELINHEDLVPVPAGAFVGVMLSAAAKGRLDVVRTMMGAVDQHLAQQGGGSLVYHESELLHIIKAAGASGDTALIATAWQRLNHDIIATTERPPIMQAPDISPGSSVARTKTQPGKPSPLAFKAVVGAYVQCKQYGKALSHVAEMEEVYGGSTAVSVYGGLAFFPMQLTKEEEIAAAFAEIKARKDADKPVSTVMMNIICRAIGRMGNTEATGKVFESLGVWGLAPDADSYNTLLESCETAKRVTAVEGLISYMASKGVEPNAASWALLLSTALHADDAKTATSALQRMLGNRTPIPRELAQRAVKLAYEKHDFQLRNVVKQADEQQQLKLKGPGVHGSWHLAPKAARQQNPEQRQQQQQQEQFVPRVDAWKPGMPSSKQQQQQREEQREQQHGEEHQQQQQRQRGGEFAHVIGEELAEKEDARSLRAGLRAVLGEEK